MRFLLSVASIFFWIVPIMQVQAATDTFHVRLVGPADTEAPSTPTLLSVTPIAYDQIDLAWTASTDNAIVSGYVVSRDGLPVATTTLLSYSDTALSASTTYSYTVQAFDPSHNYSSSSSALATTTPEAPILTSSGSGGGATVAKVVLEDFAIETGISTTSFSLRTTHQARLEIRWGRTASYELGYIVGGVYTRDHSLLLTDLEPGTTYEYEIVGYTPAGAETILKQSSFKTKSINIPTSPSNVSWFEAMRNGVDVDLSWQLPMDVAVDHVRIVRSHFGFPQSPQDGAIIYQGLDTKAFDGNVLAQYSPVYYTAFVYDEAGNVSTGAVAIVYAAGTSGTGSSTTPIEPVTVATSTVNGERIPPESNMPILTDIIILQDTLRTTFDQPGITLDATHDFTLSIPKAAVARNLKSIIATITDPQDLTKQHSFLLRINKEGTAYEARIPRVVVSGTAQIMISIYDYEAFVVATYQAPITFIVPATTKRAPVLFPDMFIAYVPPTLFGLGFLTLFVLIWLLIKRPFSRRPAEGK